MSNLVHVVLATIAVTLAGCEDLDAYHRPYVWYPTGAPQGNLAVMVAKPNDLIRGHGDGRVDGPVGEAAVTRLLQDRAKPLPNPGDSSSGGSGKGSGGATPGAGG
jgi:type IV pilus biogenesis protein CpaD/CtpE